MSAPLSSSSPGLLRAIVHGSLGFAAVSVAAFSVWAFFAAPFRQMGGELGMYGAIAVVFLVLSGVVLGPLAGGVGRFYKVFLPAFLVYCVLWCVVYFYLKGKPGEWGAAIASSLGFTGVSLWLLGSLRGFLVVTVVFFVLHTVGYFAGDWVMHGWLLTADNLREMSGPEKQQVAQVAKLSWGLLYGLGFGAGIGWVFHRARVGA